MSGHGSARRSVGIPGSGVTCVLNSSEVCWQRRRDGVWVWWCLGCDAHSEVPGGFDRSKSYRHDCSKYRFLRELGQANRVVEDAGALVTEEGGFRHIDVSKLPDEFVEYYRGLRQVGYAIGAIP